MIAREVSEFSFFDSKRFGGGVPTLAAFSGNSTGCTMSLQKSAILYRETAPPSMVLMLVISLDFCLKAIPDHAMKRAQT